MSSVQYKTSSPGLENNIKSPCSRAGLAAKRALDLIIAVPAFIVLLPVMVIIGIAIRIDSPGPAIFKQKRAGLKGVPFTIYKFRTMVKDAERNFSINVSQEELKDFVFQDENDTRITRLGAFLRKTSLDELPQLLNVINGTMSLVGPRPEIFEIVDMYDEEQRRRLDVKPGITGLAQIMGRGELRLEETIAYDLEYIRNLSLRTDLMLIFKTLGAVITRKGAF